MEPCPDPTWLLHNFNSSVDKFFNITPAGDYGLPSSLDVSMEPALEFINGILMDEPMEDPDLDINMETSYQAIVNSFYEILQPKDDPFVALQAPHMIVGEEESRYNAILNGFYNILQQKNDQPVYSNGDGGGDVMQELEDGLIGKNLEGGGQLCSNGAGLEQGHGVGLNGAAKGLPLQAQDRVWQEVVRGANGKQDLHGDEGFKTDIAGNGSSFSAAKNGEDGFSFVKNEDLNAEDDAKLYGEQWMPAPSAKANGEDGKGRGEGRRGRGRGKGRGRGRSEGEELQVQSLDFVSMIMECAQAMSSTQYAKAKESLSEIRRYASPRGSAMQRLAHYFVDALGARLSGNGAQLHAMLSSRRPPVPKQLKVYSFFFRVSPFFKLAHFFANHNILKAAEGASRLHVVDYGILYGVQWPSLISALAERKGGPPFLHITGIEFTGRSMPETGRRLTEYARTYNVPFHYTEVVADRWEDIEPEKLAASERGAEEVLVVTCIKRLRHLMDETVAGEGRESARTKVLGQMRLLNPNLLITVVSNGGHSSPFFVPRVKEALHYFASHFDMLESTAAPGDAAAEQWRATMEAEWMGRDIMGVVACEGPDRAERPESFRQWNGRLQRAGFNALSLDPLLVSKAQALTRRFYHREFDVHHDPSNSWLLLGWKGRVPKAMATWRPSPL